MAGQLAWVQVSDQHLGEGFAHLHIHVVPRMPDFPPEVRGPRVFAFLRDSPDEWLPDPELDTVARQVRAALSG